MKRYFELSCHALIGAAFFSLALTGRLDAFSILAFSSLFGIGLYRTIRRRPPLLSAHGAFVLSFLYIAVFLVDITMLSRSIVDGAIHMLLFLEMAKLHQEKSDRDYFYLIALAFVKVLAASSLTIDMSFAATLLLFLIAFISTLMSFEMYRAQPHSPTTTRNAVRSLSGVSVWMGVWIILLGAGLFFIIPRFGIGYFTRAASSPLLVSGFTDSVTLGQIGQLKLNSAVVMHAKRQPGTPFTLVKWRGVTLDTFNGLEWSKKYRARRFVQAHSGVYTFKEEPIRGQLLNYSILLEPLATTTLFGPLEVRNLTTQVLPGIDTDDAGSIYARFQQSRRQQYSVQAEIAKPLRKNDAPTAQGEGLNPRQLETYLQLPGSLDPRIRTLAQQITATASTPYDKAVQIEAYLKRNYQYSLTLTWNPGDDPLSAFLFNAKNGHCEYFASSMAVLLRAAGVPTRIVNGFLMGEYNPIGDAYIVRQSDAHSWVEAYIPGRSWTEFDPTPPDDSQQDSGFMAQVGNYADAASLFWNSYILTYDTDSQMQLFRSAQDSVQDFQEKLRQRTDQWATTIQGFADSTAAGIRTTVNNGRFWVFLSVSLVLFGGLRYRDELWTRTQLLVLHPRTGASAERMVATLFYRAVRMAERQSPRRLTSQTWREWIDKVPHEERRTVLGRALEIFERTRYGRQSASADDFAQLQQAVREMRSLLQ